MKLLRSLVLATAALSIGIPTTARASWGWSPWFSEETSPAGQTCSADSVVTGVACRGSRCDDIRIRCESVPSWMTLTNHRWEPSITDDPGVIVISSGGGDFIRNDDHTRVCTDGGGVVTGMWCSNSYCDDVWLACADPVEFVGGEAIPVEPDDCWWSGSFSEEDPPFTTTLGSQTFMTGAYCWGSHCDNKFYRVCEFIDARSTCAASCGGQSPQGCYCDQWCASYGDCCPDYENVCD